MLKLWQPARPQASSAAESRRTAFAQPEPRIEDNRCRTGIARSSHWSCTVWGLGSRPTFRETWFIGSLSQVGPDLGAMAQDMTDDRADGLADVAGSRATRFERQLAPGPSGAGQDPDRLERRARERRHVGLSWSAGWAKHSAGGQAERHIAPGVNRRPTMGTLVKRRHEPEFAQAGQLEPQD